jgi:hypothetical protein
MPKGTLRRPVVTEERVLVAWKQGVSALGHDGKSIWTHSRQPPPVEAESEEEGPAPLTTGLVRLGDGIAFGTADGRVVWLALEDGTAHELARPGTKRLVGEPAAADGRLFVAERGGAVHALRVNADASAAKPAWTNPVSKAANRTLALAGGKLFALNGSGLDFFRDEIPLLVALDPATGALTFQRPVSRPASLSTDGDLVLVASGGARSRGGLRVLGAHPQQTVDAKATQLLELRSAASDALVDGQFEVAAIVARKLLRAVGGEDKFDGTENLEFLARVLARSNRPTEALDMIHRAEEQAGVEAQDHWDAVRRELGFEDEEEEPEEPEEPEKEAPEKKAND